MKGPRPLPDTAEAGHRLRTLRTERSLSTRELGRRAGVDQSVIVRVEKGRLRPGPELLVRLLDALDAPAGEQRPHRVGHGPGPGLRPPGAHHAPTRERRRRLTR